jgi:hypothetical protein
MSSFSFISIKIAVAKTNKKNPKLLYILYVREEEKKRWEDVLVVMKK